MDAIVLLRKDHSEAKKLFTRFEKGDTSVVPDICDALDRHAALEETYFYPAVRQALEESGEELDVILESVEEHHVVHVLIGELRDMGADDENYRAKATVLVENTRHHIEEEESELFPQVREVLGRKKLQEIGQVMADAMESGDVVDIRSGRRVGSEVPA
jgi:hemerythrin superfamily protein